MVIAANIIVFWDSTDASIPSGWTRVTSLDARYVKGAAAATNPDVTGGAANHTHISPSHSHTLASHYHSGITGSGGSSSTTNYQNGRQPDDLHHHNYSSGAITGTGPDAGTATWNNTASDPSYFEVVFIESDGTPVGIPDGAMCFFNSGTPPTGWIQHVGSKDRFLKGATGGGNGGSTSSTSAHVHTGIAHGHGGTIGNHQHGTANSGGSRQSRPWANNSSGSFGRPTTDHAHSTSYDNSGSTAVDSATSGDTASTTYEPSFHTLLAIENDTGADETPVNIIASYLGTLTSIPDNWFLCDGTNGTPDLRDKFIKCANVGGDVGTTGGSDGHDHGDPAGHSHGAGHTHAATHATSTGSPTGSSGFGDPLMLDHSHLGSTTNSAGSTTSDVSTIDSNSDTQPPFRTVAYIQFQAVGIHSAIPGIIGV